jgi:hypothetical protein
MIFFEKGGQAFEDFGWTGRGLIGRHVSVNGTIELGLFVPNGWGLGMVIRGFNGVER